MALNLGGGGPGWDSMSPSSKRLGAGACAVMGSPVTVSVRLLVLNPTDTGAVCTVTHPNPVASWCDVCVWHRWLSSVSR
jgi:hypothetical protein